MSDIHDRVLQGLSPLLGLKMSIARHAGNMRNFHFGALPAEPKPCGQYALHISCPWRLESADEILTGFHDWYTPTDPDTIPDDDWEPARGGSLQEAALQNLMHDETHGSIFNKTGQLIVTDVSADRFRGFSLDLTGGVRLSVFPCSSRGEAWRIFQPGKDSEHFVVERDV